MGVSSSQFPNGTQQWDKIMGMVWFILPENDEA